jgi:hypothetical protein
MIAAPGLYHDGPLLILVRSGKPVPAGFRIRLRFMLHKCGAGGY